MIRFGVPEQEILTEYTKEELEKAKKLGSDSLNENTVEEKEVLQTAAPLLHQREENSNRIEIKDEKRHTKANKKKLYSNGQDILGSYSTKRRSNAQRIQCI